MLKNPVLQIYGITTIALVLQFIPIINLQILSALVFVALLAGLPVIRKKSPEDSPLRAEAGYLFRTLWIWSGLLTIGLVIAGYLVSQSFTLDQVMSITQNLSAGQIGDEQTRKFTHIAAFAIAPSMLYFVVRLAIGWRRALRKDTGL